MTIDEKDVEQRRRVYELFDRLGAELDAKRAAARKKAGPLLERMNDAHRAGDLSAAAKRAKAVAAFFSAEDCQGDAETYRLRARDFSAELRRRNWVDKRKGKR